MVLGCRPLGGRSLQGAFVAVASLVGVLCAVRSLAGRIGGSRRHAAQVVDVQVHPSGCGRAGMPGAGRLEAPGRAVCVLTLQAGEGHHPFTLVNADTGDGRLRLPSRRWATTPRDWRSRWPWASRCGWKGRTGDSTSARDRAPEQVWVAAGIGATPFVAWLESLVASRPRPRWCKLHYCVRNAQEAVFAERMQQLCAQLPSVTLHIHHSDVTGKVAADALLASAGPQASVWFCGPQGFGQALRDFPCSAWGRGQGRFHQGAVSDALSGAPSSGGSHGGALAVRQSGQTRRSGFLPACLVHPAAASPVQLPPGQCA